MSNSNDTREALAATLRLYIGDVDARPLQYVYLTTDEAKAILAALAEQPAAPQPSVSEAAIASLPRAEFAADGYVTIDGRPWIGRDDHDGPLVPLSAVREMLAAPQAEPPGFVLVPKEPTPEMVKAMKDGRWAGGSTHRVYAAMLAAAPAAPAQEPQQPARWTPEEIAAGKVGIRWVTDDGVQGRPTEDDVRRYLAHMPEGLRSAAPAQEPQQAWGWNGNICAVWGIAVVLGETREIQEANARTIAAAFAVPHGVQAEPLTKEQIDFICADSFLAANGGVYSTRIYDFVAAIEQAHGIGAAPAAPAQEPQQPAAAGPAGDVWRKAVQEAYGWLWHVNNEPMAPVPLWSPEKAAYEARKNLRGLLTTAERGEAINSVAGLLSNKAAASSPAPAVPAVVGAPVAYLRSITHPDWLELCEAGSPGAWPVYAADTVAELVEALQMAQDFLGLASAVTSREARAEMRATIRAVLAKHGKPQGGQG